jgi:organic hydroperoxide reductase OsmC/OhrA
MPQHRIHLRWNASEDNENYRWTLENGHEVCAVAPGSDDRDHDFIDPEEAFIGAIASCHLLSFVTEAARDGFVVDGYEDQPVGMLEKDRQGKLFVGKVLLTPKASFGGERQPSDSEVDAIHRRARGKCIISNSVTSEIILEPIF